MDTELLTCIFTGDYIEDPVTTPNCGHTFGRSELKNYKDVKGDDFDCPICRTPLDDFDIDNAPKNILISNLIESLKSQNLPAPPISISGSPVWNGNQYILNNTGGVKCIELESNISLNQNKSLLIPVIDKSGSMSGNPMTQVNYSVKRVVDQTKNSQNLITEIITYDDNYTIYNTNNVPNIIASGGTNFRNAFKGLYEVLKKHKDDNFVSECIVVFLTDGQDCSGDRAKLPIELKEELLKIWKKPIIIHTIGFGNGHDFTLLDNLRKCGSIEGAYRFADPSENLDSLSAKLNGIYDAVSGNINTKINISLPSNVLNLNELELNMICDVNLNDKISKGKLYVRTELDEYEIKVKFGNIENIIQIKTESNSEKEEKLWKDWVDILIEQITSEFITLNSSTIKDSSNKLHSALLLQRLKSIKKQKTIDEQLDKIDTLYKMIKNNNTIDAKKLIDMKYESQFKTKFDKPVISNPLSINSSNQNIPNVNQNSGNVGKADNFKPYQFRNIRNYQGGQSQLKLMSTTVNKINFDEITNEKDKIGNNCVHLMSMNGRYHTIKKLLELNIFDINTLNNYNETALDLAALYGHSGTYKLLRDNGGKHNLNGDMLLYTTLMKSSGEYRTSTLLLENKVSTLCPAFLAKAPTKESFNWMLKTQAEFMDTSDKFHAGLSNCNFKAVQSALEENPELKFDITNYFNLFETKTVESARIVNLLIEKKLFEVDCTFPTSNELNMENDEDKEKISFPLFKACGCGNITLVNILLKYLTTEQINRQNNMGATALWIASCNGHLDIVLSLLQKGADPNISNFKGDSPLIPACQKGYVSVVEALLESGASLECYNKNRDNPIILCCRNGQNKILEVVLKFLPKDKVESLLNDMNNCAQIDGFNPILAAAEVNKVECIKVLHSFGANINIKTSDLNSIIKGATPLHLACHYNRFASVKTLIELGANINDVTLNGMSALHIAVKGKYLDIAEYLIKNNIDMEIKDNEFNKAEFYADKTLLTELFTEPITNPLLELIKSTNSEFVSKGCDILKKYTNSYGSYEYSDLVDLNMGNGITPLTISIQMKNRQLFETLLNMGADLNKMDSNGFTPKFWINSLNFNNENYQLNEIETFRMNKLRDIQKKNIQYKMLTSYDKVYGNDLVTCGTILDKMNLGTFSNVNDEIMENLEISEFCEQSLVGFLDKYKNTMIYNEAKIKLIELVSTLECKLTPVQILSLYLWTCSEDIYKTVYNILSNQIKSNQIFESYIYTFYSSLKTLQPYTEEVYRALEYSDSISFSKESYPIGGIIKWNSFSSTSSDWKFIAPYTTEKKGIIFIIHSKSGRLIKHFSKNPNDNEVVFLPNTSFRIDYYYKANLVCLGQENIRKTTYTFSDTDIEKAQNKKISVIIELTEI
jgi:ankyrin repeat protein